MRTSNEQESGEEDAHRRDGSPGDPSDEVPNEGGRGEDGSGRELADGRPRVPSKWGLEGGSPPREGREILGQLPPSASHDFLTHHGDVDRGTAEACEAELEKYFGDRRKRGAVLSLGRHRGRRRGRNLQHSLPHILLASTREACRSRGVCIESAPR
jgi:hypothetical protein